MLIGHAGHEEVVGTMGEAPDAIVLVESVEDAEGSTCPPDTKLAYITQTTLSVDETAEIIGRCAAASRNPRAEEGRHLLRDLQPAVGREGDARRDRPPARDRLDATRSNSNRLVEVARAARRRAYLIDDETEIDEAWLAGVETVGSRRARPRRRSSSSASAIGSAREASTTSAVQAGRRGRRVQLPVGAPPRARLADAQR